MTDDHREAHEAIESRSERKTDPPPEPASIAVVQEEIIATRVELGEAVSRLDNFAERAETKADEIGGSLVELYAQSKAQREQIKDAVLKTGIEIEGLATNQLGFDVRLGRIEEKQDAAITDIRGLHMKLDRILTKLEGPKI